MTGIDLRSTPIAAHELRAEVRTCLEEEYLRLLAADEEQQSEELESRIAAIFDYLGSVRTPRRTGRPELDYGVLVDLGDGPRWMLIADLPVPHDRVVTADSPLGRALLAASVDEPFVVDFPEGPRTGTVLAVEVERPAPRVPAPAAPSEPSPHRLIVLDATRAMELLAARSPGIGRLAFSTFGTPHIEVVNFLVEGGAVHFRVDAGAKLIAVNQGARFALQVDDLDGASRSGWTVTVSGPVVRIHGSEAERIGALLRPWAAGERRFVLRMMPSRIFGRALTATAPVG